MADVEVENEKLGVVIMRLRVEKPRLPYGRPFATAGLIEWPYGSGLPEPSVKEQMDAFEAATDELTSDNGFTELVRVQTGLGRREWLFYTCDQARFMERLNALLAGRRAYPLQITFGDDPDWNLWRETVDEVHSRGVAGGAI